VQGEGEKTGGRRPVEQYIDAGPVRVADLCS
jgi:hypothetical protein